MPDYFTNYLLGHTDPTAHMQCEDYAGTFKFVYLENLPLTYTFANHQVVWIGTHLFYTE